MKNKATKYVDPADLLKAKVIQLAPGHLSVVFECVEPDKKVVFDSSALKVLNEKITEKVAGMKYTDPKVVMYIEEFAMKSAVALYKNGLCALEEIPDAKDDPYKKFRGR